MEIQIFQHAKTQSPKKILSKKPKSFKISIITLSNHHTEDKREGQRKAKRTTGPPPTRNSTTTNLKFQHKS